MEASPGMDIARCASCDAEIVWCVTSKGTSMPIDPLPVPGGNVVLDGERKTRMGRMAPFALVLSHGDVPLGDPPRYRSHFVSCPFAEQHRRRR